MHGGLLDPEEYMFSRKTMMLVLAGVGILIFPASYLPASGGFERVSESGIRVLEVDASMLHVEVNGGAGLVLTGWGEDVPANVKVRCKRRGDVLRVSVEKRLFPFALRGEGRLFFEVPGEVDLDIRTASGRIVVRNMSSARVMAGSASGSISISRVRAEVEVQSSSGDINLGMIEGNLRAESSSGGMELVDVNGKVSATVSSGNLRISAIEGDIAVSSSSGKILLSSTAGALDLHTSSGDIIGEGVRLTNDSRFKTASGRIDVGLINQLNDLSFRLSSSSGRLQVGNLRGEKSLAAGEGTIRVSGESGSGDQLYR